MLVETLEDIFLQEKLEQKVNFIPSFPSHFSTILWQYFEAIIIPKIELEIQIAMCKQVTKIIIPEISLNSQRFVKMTKQVFVQ